MTRSITLQVDTKPQFPGGISEFYKFVAKKFQRKKLQNETERKSTLKIYRKDGSLLTLAFFAI
jgi:hypothetical protein